MSETKEEKIKLPMALAAKVAESLFYKHNIFYTKLDFSTSIFTPRRAKKKK